MMIPYPSWLLLEINGFSVEFFTVLIGIAVLLGHHIAVRQGVRMGLDPGVIRFVSPRIVIVGFVMAHLVSIVAYHPERAMKDPWVLARLSSGLSSVGGIVGAALTFTWLVRRLPVPALPLADALAMGLAPAWVIGRLGCFTAHDHPGHKTSFFLAVAYPGGPRHDLGLYEALSTAIIAVMLFAHARAARGPGSMVGFLALAYPPSRFLLDFLGRPDPRWLGLTLAQYACLACFGFGLAVVRAARNQFPYPSVAGEAPRSVMTTPQSRGQYRRVRVPEPSEHDVAGDGHPAQRELQLPRYPLLQRAMQHGLHQEGQNKGDVPGEHPAD